MLYFILPIQGVAISNSRTHHALLHLTYSGVAISNIHTHHALLHLAYSGGCY